MAISYLSKPLQSTIKPFQENVGLIAQVAQQKQNKYDQLVTALFQRENQLLSLDMNNEQRRERKNTILRDIDEQLSSMASLDLLNPENIKKIDGLFNPILEDQVLMREVAQTKAIRANQELYEKAQKKNPSLGNQQNYNVSQNFVAMHAQAKGDENIDEIAKYTTLFAPYVDVKAKDAKAFHDLGLDKGTEVETKIGVGGVKYTKTTEGYLTDAQILAKVNALRTPEDEYQLMLDGYSKYGNVNLDQMMGSLQSKLSTTSKSIQEGLKDVDTKLKIYDKNGDGQFDNPNDPMQANNYREYTALMDQKSYLKQLQTANQEYAQYADKYSKSKDLNLGERLQLFQKIASDDLAVDLTTLFSRPEGTKNIFEYDDTDLFKENEATKRAMIKAAGKQKKEKDPILLKHIDINDNGWKDDPTKDIYVTSDHTTEYANVTEEELKKIKNPKVIGDYKINLSNGKTISGNLNKSGISITSWEDVFNKDYETGAENAKTFITNQFDLMSNDGTGVNNKKKEELFSRFEQYSKQYEEAKGDQAKIAALNKTYGDVEGPEFQTLYNYQKNLAGVGNIADIRKSIDRHLMIDKGFDKAFVEASKGISTIGTLITKDNFKNFLIQAPAGSENIYDKIKDISISKTDSSEDILKKMSTKLSPQELKYLYASGTKIGNIASTDLTTYSPIAETVSLQVEDIMKNSLQRLAKNFYTEKQEIYKSLLDANAALIINMPVTELKDQKEDPFHRKVLGIFTKRMSNPETLKLDTDTNKYVPLTAEEKKTLSTKVGGVELEQYNTATGTVTGKVDGVGILKIQLVPNDAKSGLPFGIPPSDLLSKNLLLDSILKQRNGKSGISKSVQVGQTSFGDIMVAYNPLYASDGGFIAYVKDNPSRIEFTGKSVRQIQGMIMQRLAGTQMNANGVPTEAEFFYGMQKETEDITSEEDSDYDTDERLK